VDSFPSQVFKVFIVLLIYLRIVIFLCTDCKCYFIKIKKKKNLLSNGSNFYVVHYKNTSLLDPNCFYF